jgi:exodeoxyribonuclease VII small subunit
VTSPRSLDSLTYEQARDELVSIVAKLEAGAATLEESLVLWERGEVLAVRCQQLLEGARSRIVEMRGEGAPASGDTLPEDPT